ncbi:hypothetical protein H257_07279 [Aphanomyces astaci]|uniref:Uncharacterized protein n=1 Tax=Aphanomyces astaci TaxID=112090 RepID=W4GHN0_APHAT|nr:hypothetical protein H257_07279 [Aphanomyces astaci]ETV79210.1 hypothetical protein H257_07279 [Aphanomyces astaci]KAF0775584.1 hypothetical protein AaE_000714 [Aphanomyces astaci]RHY13527.1 hypothetical protein DYB36_004478 [Aphanomyces astaci]RHY37059.1 hypothetical protein DYB25_003881 [Aphanomyces astaci]RHY37652.1 hypothetical protein DYB34_005563 [Aphanomyces astaci]|eukprot:XP_009831051.1 hypothetical protein H257_07279 [Aphanomyces astaci]
MPSPSAASSTSGLYDWCDIAEVAAAQRKSISRKVNATTLLASKASKKSKKHAMPSTRTTFRQQHEAMQRRHSSHAKPSSTSLSIMSAAASRFESHLSAAATVFAPQLPRLL